MKATILDIIYYASVVFRVGCARHLDRAKSFTIVTDRAIFLDVDRRCGRWRQTPVISTINAERSPARSSDAPVRVKILLIGSITACLAGVKVPVYQEGNQGQSDIYTWISPIMGPVMIGTHLVLSSPHISQIFPPHPCVRRSRNNPPDPSGARTF